MLGTSYLSLATLILLLIPIVVLPWEGRRIPNWLYATIALGGIIAATLRGGVESTAWASLAGFVTLLAVAGIATGIRRFFNLQVFTSGHIKLLSAGATWLGPTGALAMGGMAFVTLVALAIARRCEAERRPPDFSTIAAIAILCVGLAQVGAAAGIDG